MLLTAGRFTCFHIAVGRFMRKLTSFGAYVGLVTGLLADDVSGLVREFVWLWQVQEPLLGEVQLSEALGTAVLASLGDSRIERIRATVHDLNRLRDDAVLLAKLRNVAVRRWSTPVEEDRVNPKWVPSTRVPVFTSTKSIAAAVEICEREVVLRRVVCRRHCVFSL